MTKRVMILATDGFEQSELMKPKANLEKAGIETVVVSLEEGSIRGWDEKNWGESVTVDKTVDAIENCDGYDALLLPGGQINPDILRMNERAVAIVREFAMADKPIAAICHAPWLLAEADVVKGKTVTGWPRSGPISRTPAPPWSTRKSRRTARSSPVATPATFRPSARH